MKKLFLFLALVAGLSAQTSNFGHAASAGSNSAGGGGGGAVSSVFGRTGDVTAETGDYAAFYPTLIGANAFTGINSFVAATVKPATAMGALAVDVTKGWNTKTIAVNSTLTFSGTPATANTFFSVLITNSDSAAHTITFPSSFIIGIGTATTTTIDASGKLLLTWQYDGSGYNLYGASTLSTGTGPYVRQTSPTLITPVLGVATATSVNKWAFTAPSTAATMAAGGDSLTYVFPASSQTIPGLTDTVTMTNKRVTPRVTTITSNATPTVDTDNCDVVSITAQAADITSMSTNFTGNPQPFDQLEYAITGTAARAITWNSSGSNFTAGPVALPTTTVTTKTLHVYYERNAANTTWLCMSSSSDL